VGTETGALHCLVIGEADKKERLWVPLLELDTPTPAVHGCYQQVRGDIRVWEVAWRSCGWSILGSNPNDKTIHHAAVASCDQCANTSLANSS
jgi:hypothetical protein